MQKTYPTTQRLLALGLSASLLWTSGISEAAVGASTPTTSLANRFAPPPSLGLVSDYFDAHSKSTIVLLQDLHAHYGVQKNIAKILDVLTGRLSNGSTNKASLPFALAVEGASGPIDSSEIAKFPPSPLKQQAADYLVRQAEMTGMEYFAVMRGLPDALQGVEDPNYYQMNRELFRKTFANRDVLVTTLKRLQEDIRPLRRQRYSPNVLEIQTEIDHFNKGNVSIIAYLENLASRAKEFQLPLQMGYPLVARYLQNPNLDHDVEMDAILHQATELAYRLKLANAKDRTEKDLIQVEHDLDLLLRVADLQATEFEVRDFAPRLNQFVALADVLTKKATNRISAAQLRQLISSSIDYYVLALTRNLPLVENTLKLIEQGSALRVTRSELKPETRNPKPVTAVLVAGGFHTAPITQILRNKKISYVVITPTVDKIRAADHDLYIRRLNGERLSEEEIQEAAAKQRTAMGRLQTRYHYWRNDHTVNAGLYGRALLRSWRIYFQTPRVQPVPAIWHGPKRSINDPKGSVTTKTVVTVALGGALFLLLATSFVYGHAPVFLQDALNHLPSFTGGATGIGVLAAMAMVPGAPGGFNMIEVQDAIEEFERITRRPIVIKTELPTIASYAHEKGISLLEATRFIAGELAPSTPPAPRVINANEMRAAFSDFEDVAKRPLGRKELATLLEEMNRTGQSFQTVVLNYALSLSPTSSSLQNLREARRQYYASFDQKKSSAEQEAMKVAYRKAQAAVMAEWITQNKDLVQRASEAIGRIYEATSAKPTPQGKARFERWFGAQLELIQSSGYDHKLALSLIEELYRWDTRSQRQSDPEKFLVVELHRAFKAIVAEISDGTVIGSTELVGKAWEDVEGQFPVRPNRVVEETDEIVTAVISAGFKPNREYLGNEKVSAEIELGPNRRGARGIAYTQVAIGTMLSLLALAVVVPSLIHGHPPAFLQHILDQWNIWQTALLGSGGGTLAAGSILISSWGNDPESAMKRLDLYTQELSDPYLKKVAAENIREIFRSQAQQYNVNFSIKREITPRVVAVAKIALEVIRDSNDLLQKAAEPIFFEVDKIVEAGVANTDHTRGAASLGLTAIELKTTDPTERRLLYRSTAIHELGHKLSTVEDKTGEDLIFPIADWIALLELHGYDTVLDGDTAYKTRDYLTSVPPIEAIRRIRNLSGGNFPKQLSQHGGKDYYVDPHEIIAWNLTGEARGRFGNPQVTDQQTQEILERNLLKAKGLIYTFKPNEGTWQTRTASYNTTLLLSDQNVRFVSEGSELHIYVPGRRTPYTFDLRKNPRIVIGRTPLVSDPDMAIVVNDPGVSKNHLRISVEAGNWKFEDLNSLSGTYQDDATHTRVKTGLLFPTKPARPSRLSEPKDSPGQQRRLTTIGDTPTPIPPAGSRRARIIIRSGAVLAIVLGVGLLAYQLGFVGGLFGAGTAGVLKAMLLPALPFRQNQRTLSTPQLQAQLAILKVLIPAFDSNDYRNNPQGLMNQPEWRKALAERGLEVGYAEADWQPVQQLIIDAIRSKDAVVYLKNLLNETAYKLSIRQAVERGEDQERLAWRVIRDTLATLQTSPQIPAEVFSAETLIALFEQHGLFLRANGAYNYANPVFWPLWEKLMRVLNEERGREPGKFHVTYREHLNPRIYIPRVIARINALPEMSDPFAGLSALDTLLARISPQALERLKKLSGNNISLPFESALENASGDLSSYILALEGMTNSDLRAEFNQAAHANRSRYWVGEVDIESFEEWLRSPMHLMNSIVLVTNGLRIPVQDDRSKALHDQALREAALLNEVFRRLDNQPNGSKLTHPNTLAEGRIRAQERRALLEKRFERKANRTTKPIARTVDLNDDFLKLSIVEQEYRLLVKPTTINYMDRDGMNRTLTREQGLEYWISEYFAIAKEIQPFKREEDAMAFAKRHPGDPKVLSNGAKTIHEAYFNSTEESGQSADQPNLGIIERRATKALGRTHQRFNRSQRGTSNTLTARGPQGLKFYDADFSAARQLLAFQKGVAEDTLKPQEVIDFLKQEAEKISYAGEPETPYFGEGFEALDHTDNIDEQLERLEDGAGNYQVLNEPVRKEQPILRHWMIPIDKVRDGLGNKYFLVRTPDFGNQLVIRPASQLAGHLQRTLIRLRNKAAENPDSLPRFDRDHHEQVTGRVLSLDEALATVQQQRQQAGVGNDIPIFPVSIKAGYPSRMQIHATGLSKALRIGKIYAVVVQGNPKVQFVQSKSNVRSPQTDDTVEAQSPADEATIAMAAPVDDEATIATATPPAEDNDRTIQVFPNKKNDDGHHQTAAWALATSAMVAARALDYPVLMWIIGAGALVVMSRQVVNVQKGAFRTASSYEKSFSQNSKGLPKKLEALLPHPLSARLYVYRHNLSKMSEKKLAKEFSRTLQMETLPEWLRTKDRALQTVIRLSIDPDKSTAEEREHLAAQRLLILEILKRWDTHETVTEAKAAPQKRGDLAPKNPLFNLVGASALHVLLALFLLGASAMGQWWGHSTENAKKNEASKPQKEMSVVWLPELPKVEVHTPEIQTPAIQPPKTAARVIPKTRSVAAPPQEPMGVVGVSPMAPLPQAGAAIETAPTLQAKSLASPLQPGNLPGGSRLAGTDKTALSGEEPTLSEGGEGATTSSDSRLAHQSETQHLTLDWGGLVRGEKLTPEMKAQITQNIMTFYKQIGMENVFTEVRFVEQNVNRGRVNVLWVGEGILPNVLFVNEKYFRTLPNGKIPPGMVELYLAHEAGHRWLRKSQELIDAALQKRFQPKGNIADSALRGITAEYVEILVTLRSLETYALYFDKLSDRLVLLDVRNSNALRKKVESQLAEHTAAFQARLDNLPLEYRDVVRGLFPVTPSMDAHLDLSAWYALPQKIADSAPVHQPGTLDEKTLAALDNVSGSSLPFMGLVELFSSIFAGWRIRARRTAQAAQNIAPAMDAVRTADPVPAPDHTAMNAVTPDALRDDPMIAVTQKQVYESPFRRAIRAAA